MRIILEKDLGGLIHDLKEQGYDLNPSNQNYPLEFIKNNEIYARLYPDHPSFIESDMNEICEIAKKYEHK